MSSLSRLAYKFCRAYGYRYMRDHPQKDREALVRILSEFLQQIEPWNRLSLMAEIQAQEAAVHVLYVHSVEKLDEAIDSPQGKFPLMEGAPARLYCKS